MDRQLAAALVLLAVGCGPAATIADAATDGGIDAGRDAGRSITDAGRDARADAEPVRYFEDRTVASGIDLFRVPAEGYETIADRISGGVCVLDADGRGAPDLFFAVRASSSGASRLYVADRPWEYADETAARGLAGIDAIGCLALDADADGDRDLLVTGIGAVELHLRGDDGTFTRAAGLLSGAIDPRVVYASAAAGDLTGDGRPDLAIAGYVVDDETVTGECAVAPCRAEPVSFDGAPNLLFVQREDGVFVDRTAELAPALGEAEHTLVVAIVDLTGHGALDLFVGNDLGVLHLNRALRRELDGVLRDVAFEIGMASDRRGFGVDAMGFATGDVDGDRLPDHVVTSFEADDSALYFCGTDGYCEDRSDAMGLEPLRTSFRWGAALFDVDLDGDLDLLEATGHFYTDAEIARRGFDRPFAQRPNLVLGEGALPMVPVVPDAVDALSTARASRGIAIADLDDDGRPDVVLAPAAGSPALLRNVVSTDAHFVRIVLRGRPPDTDAIGARVRVRAPGLDLVRARVVGEGYLGSFDPRITIGVGAATAVDVEVTWLSGTVTEVRGVAADGELEILEPIRPTARH